VKVWFQTDAPSTRGRSRKAEQQSRPSDGQTLQWKSEDQTTLIILPQSLPSHRRSQTNPCAKTKTNVTNLPSTMDENIIRDGQHASYRVYCQITSTTNAAYPKKDRRQRVTQRLTCKILVRSLMLK
ncbi:hypothetical protein CEXT_438761, partial [Caerostris extrusa]